MKNKTIFLENPNLQETEKMLVIFKKIAKNKILTKNEIEFFEDEMIGYMLHETQGWGHLSNKSISEMLHLDFENVKEYVIENYLQSYNPMLNLFKC